MATIELPEMKSIQSSAFQAIGYDSENKTLFVEFHSGKVYTYFDVNSQTVDNLWSASSAGVFFNLHIRNKHNHTLFV